jgi:hypothetical protein
MDIRKIAVGPDYKNAMHYQIGQTVLGGDYTIDHIRKSKEDLSIRVYIEKTASSEIVCWKEFSPNMPISCEFNIDF